MHRSQIESIIQKQVSLLGVTSVKKILNPIPEIELDSSGRLINLSKDNDEVLNHIVTLFLNYSHEIVKGLLFELDGVKMNEHPSEAEKTPVPASHDQIQGSVPNPSEPVEELVPLAPDEPYKHSGSDAIEKALDDLKDRVSAEGSQDGPSSATTSASEASSQSIQAQSSGSTQKLNDLIKQYNQ